MGQAFTTQLQEPFHSERVENLAYYHKSILGSNNKMLCWHKNLYPYPNVGCPQFCFKHKCVVCMGICMEKQPISFWGMGMENQPKFNFFLHFPLIYTKSDSAVTGASWYDHYSPQWGALVYTPWGSMENKLFSCSVLWPNKVPKKRVVTLGKAKN